MPRSETRPAAARTAAARPAAARPLQPLRALLAHNLLLARRDLAPLIVFIAMPLALMAFLQPAMRLSLHADGHTTATGAEQAVPGMAVMFVLYMVGVVGFRVFEEHGWATWDRLRASPASRTAIIVGKVAPSFLVLATQLVVLFVAGALLYDLAITGSLLALALVATAFAVTVLSLGMLLAAVLSTMQQINAAANIGATALAGLGGAIVPLGVLPGWAQAVAPATPSHWAMEGFRTVILEAGGITDVAGPVLALCAFAAAFLLLGAARFRVDDVKMAMV